MANLQIDFPEGKEILRSLSRDTKAQMKVFEDYIRELNADKSKSEDLRIFMKSYVEVFFYNDLNKKYKRYKRELAMYEGNGNVLDVATAKTIPIEDLHEFVRVRTSSQRITTKCPFHDEKIPSFVIYRNNNSFHCFSCKSSGDSISFVMKLHDMEFVPAVKYLLNIKGVV